MTFTRLEIVLMVLLFVTNILPIPFIIWSHVRKARIARGIYESGYRHPKNRRILFKRGNDGG